MMNSDVLNVLLISPQVLFRQGVELALSSIEDINIMGSLDLYNEFEDSIVDLPPDIAVLDIDASSEDGINLCHTLKQLVPDIGIIIIANEPDDALIFQALQAQAAACQSKEITIDQLVETIRLVARGEYPVSQNLISRPSLADRVLKQFQELLNQNKTPKTNVSPLTPRETEVLNYIAQGYINKEIAAELKVSEQTIKNHVTSILHRLDAHARTEAVVLALKRGILSLA